MAMRYCIKHSGASDADSLHNDPETIRRVMVRRGRVVPHSHYMSLTGSLFGLGAFGPEESRSGARSKSPFEWWNSIHSRSNSSVSQMMRGSAMGTSQAPEPMLTGETPQKQGPSPLRNAASFEPMSEKLPTYTFPSRPALAHRTPRTTNFSRPAPGSRPGLFSPSVNSSLPQILEASPHQSMISSRQSKQSVFSEKAASSLHISELEAPLSPASLTGFGSRTNSHAEISSTISSTEQPFGAHSAVNRQRSKTRIPQPIRNNHPPRLTALPRSPRPADNGLDTNMPTSTRLSATQTDRRSSRNQTASPALPQSLHRSTSTLNSRRSSNYRGPGDADHITGQLSNASLQALPQPSPTTDHSPGAYWEPRQDLQPVRRKSKKGKVLRKKSLKRAETTSLVQ